MRIDGPSRCFVANDRISRLSPTQAVVLNVLLRKHPHYTSREDIESELDRMSRGSVQAYKELWALRRLLANHDLDLITVRGKGCRIVNGA